MKSAGTVLVLALAAAPSLLATPMFYGITQTGALFTVDPVSLLISQLGTVPGGISLIGLAGNGTNLYTFDRNSNTILQIDPTTANTIGAAINVNLGAAVIGEGDFTFGSATSGFISSAQFPAASIYSFTLGFPGTSALLHTDSSAATRVFLDGLAFDGGTLYGLQQGGANLYTVATGTGVPAVDGATTIAAGGYTFGGLAFNAANNTMYGALSNNSLANLYTFNPATGAGNLVGAIGNLTNVVGLAEFDANPISPTTPEPATLILLGAGLLAIAAWSHRRTT